jgi:formylglycine-generating enzyme required for sulfatase activity
VGSPVLAGTDGSYTISGVPAGTGYSIEAALTGYNTNATGDFAVNGNVTGKNLTLVKTSGPVYTVSGTITTDNPGGPAVNAQVQLKQNGSSAGSPVLTGTNGTYTITGVSAGFYNIEVSLSGYTPGATGDFAVSGAVTGKNLTLAKISGPVYTVSGTISTDEPDGPAAGAVVQLKRNGSAVGSPVLTGTDGTYAINGVPAGTGYSIEAALTGYNTRATVDFAVNGAVTGKNLTLAKISGPVYTVSGIITTNNPNSPASGAQVQLKQGGVNVGSPVSTEIDGTYTISAVPAGFYSIEVSLSGYTAGTISAFQVNGHVTGKNLELALAPVLYTVSGIISTDNPGGPVTGAVVQLKQGAVNIGSPVLAGTGGTYAISDVPAGTGYSIEAALSGYITGTTSLFPVNGNITNKDMVLVKIPSAVYIISGTITTDDPPDGPASGALVQLKQSGVNILSPVLTGTNGTYAITGVPPGSGYSIEVSLSGYTTGTSAVPFDVTGNALGQNLTLEKINVPVYTVSGIISTDNPGGPANEAVVQLKQSGINVGSPVYTGTGGTYTISNVPAGTGYSIEAALSGYITGATGEFAVSSGAVTGKNLTLVKIPSAVYTISGTITTNNPGGPANGALVQLKQSGVNTGSPVLTGTNGTYAINGVTPGTGYSIEVSLSGYTTGTSDIPFDVAGNAPDKNLTLIKINVPVYTVSGTISTDNPGGPVTGAVVQLKQNGVNTGSPVYTGTGGTYTINDVPAGTGYSVEAALSGYITGATVDFAVSGAVTGQNLTLIKTPSAVYTVSGTITTDDPGGPASGAQVQLKQGGVNAGSPVLTGTNGTYAINGVTPGTGYSIEVSLSGYTTGESGLFGVAGNTPDQNLELVKINVPVYTVSGIISTDNPGGPATGALVQLKQGTATVGSLVLTGIDGSYTISGVTPGTYSIEAALSGYFVGVTPAFPVSGNVTGKNLRLIKISADVQIRTISDVSIIFRYVPAGSFQRDSTAANISVITTGYWMGETEVSQELFQVVMGTNPSSFTGSSAASGEVQNRRPVETVNWYAAIAFCNKLSLLDGKEPVYSVDGISDWANLAYSAIPTSVDTTWDAAVMDTGKNGYRLPTEMEWMWAAMGADKTAQPNTTGYDKAFAGSTGSNSVDDYAWYNGNSNSKTHEVGKKQANELGLYDMSGNVWEWCWDWYGSYSSGSQTNPTGAFLGTARVNRGGSWYHSAGTVRSAFRGGNTPSDRLYNLGFRLARPQF